MIYHNKKIESLVSGNIRIDGKVYTPRQAEIEFKGNQTVREAINRAWQYHIMAKDDILTVSDGLSSVDILLSRITKDIKCQP
jgi:hypothetical protein